MLIFGSLLRAQVLTHSSKPSIIFALMSKFTLTNASAGKRAAESSGGPSKKIPKVSEMKKEAPRVQTQRATTNAPLNICIYKYTEAAGDVWGQFKDQPTQPLWQARS